MIISKELSRFAPRMYSYRIEFETDVDTGKICVRIPSLNNATDYGDTIEDALAHLRYLGQTVLEYFVDEKRTIPPSDEMQNGEIYLSFDVHDNILSGSKRELVTA